MKTILQITCKTVLPLFFAAFFANEAKAQLKSYGTIGNALVGENAFLDVSENTVNYPNNRGRGLSFPRTNLTAWTFITGNLDGLSFPTAFDGMIVYNSGTGTTLAGQGIQTSVTPGFYYFYNPGATNNITNGQWIRLSSGTVNVVSSDGGNAITSGTDGGAFIDAAAIAAAQTVTTMTDNTNGTYTYISEDGTGTTIDVPGSVINNASAIFGDTNVLNEISTIVGSSETLTSLVDNGDGTMTYTDEDGVATVINLSTAVAATETLTSLVDNGDGTMTYTDEDGVATVINLSTAVAATETLTSLVDNGNGTFTYTSENGTVTTFDANGLSVSNVIAGHLIATVTEANGTSVAIDETVTTVNDIVGGTGHTIASYTNEDGVVTNINETVTTFVDNGDGTYTYTNENGIPTTTAAASNTNIYSVDGTLTGDRVVAYSDNDLTFDIGGNNGRFILNGTFQKDGAVYYSYRVESGATVTWLDKDYVVIFTNLGIDGNLTFPSAALYPGRVLKLANDTASALTFGGIPGDTAPLNVSNIPSRTASEYISTGTDWVRITGR